MNISGMAEPIRLVVWDLDDTLWRGTLSEEGDVEHVEAHYDIIRILTRRGVISSICSRNDYDDVKGVLTGKGIWDELIFPSVDWTAKGPRLEALVKATQLRPSSILFIDDNRANLAEATAMLPGIQVADPSVIASLLDDPRIQGAPDPQMERLAHYRVLEKRHLDRDCVVGDNLSFLRNSGIEISFEYDVEGHIDRAIELINRTNQLNFTKSRLPADPEVAGSELRALICQYDVKAALIRVSDIYGDHGYCGLYVIKGANSWAKLLHYCFSCRIMGMGVEQKVLELIGSPQLDVVGEVASDLTVGPEIDWITVSAERRALEVPHIKTFSDVRLRGGCDLDGIGHYFGLYTDNVIAETNYVREHLFFRRDCSTNLLLNDSTGEGRNINRRFGIEDQDYSSRLFAPVAGDALTVLSMWGDLEVSHYRHRKSGLLVADNLHNLCQDAGVISESEISEKFASTQFNTLHREAILSYISLLKTEFEYIGTLSADLVLENTMRLFNLLPGNRNIFLLLPSEFYVDVTGAVNTFKPAVEYNALIRSLAKLYKCIKLVAVDEHINSISERQSGFTHFDRKVYFRVFQQIMESA